MLPLWGSLRSARVSRPHHDSGLCGGDAALASEATNRLVEIRRVPARELHDVVEASCHECHPLRRRQPESELLESPGIGGGQEPHVDEGGEAPAKPTSIDVRRVAADDVTPLQPSHALGDGVSAQPDLGGDLGEGGTSVPDERIEDSVVDLAGHVGIRSLGPGLLQVSSSAWHLLAMTVVGVPAETKADEYRVGLTPGGVRELVSRGHHVIVQSGAGEGSAISDADYAAQGASLTSDVEDLYATADVIVKVKEPQGNEVALLRPGTVLFTYLHLAPNPQLTADLLSARVTSIAYETVTDADGRLPLLAPMSEIAGRIAAQAGAFMLEKPMGGRGTLLGGVPGVAPCRVMVIGAGVVGENAAGVAAGMGAEVYVLDLDLGRLRQLESRLAGRVSTVHSSTLAIEQLLPEVDLVIGAVLVHGARAPRVITRSQLGLMRKNAVLVDVSIDQGGCFETSIATTHSEPVYSVDEIVHYCVANMPGAVPVTATAALTNATLPYLVNLCDVGVRDALGSDPGFRAGLATIDGVLTSQPVATDQGTTWTAPADALALRGGRRRHVDARATRRAT